MPAKTRVFEHYSQGAETRSGRAFRKKPLLSTIFQQSYSVICVTP